MRYLLLLMAVYGLLAPLPAHAGLTFNGTSQYLTATVLPATTEPITFCAWGNTTTTAATAFIVHVENHSNAAQDGSYGLRRNTTTVQARKSDDSGVNGTGSQGTLTTNTWFHACATLVADNDRTGWLNGTGTANTTTITDPTINIAAIGAFYRTVGSTGAYWSGMIAHVAIWNSILTTAEISALAGGASPWCVRRAELVSYTPLFEANNPQADWGAPRAWTPVNTPTLGTGPPVAIGSCSRN